MQFKQLTKLIFPSLKKVDRRSWLQDYTMYHIFNTGGNSSNSIYYITSTYTILPYYAVKSNTKPKTWGIVIKDITVIIRSLMEHEGKL